MRSATGTPDSDPGPTGAFLGVGPSVSGLPHAPPPLGRLGNYELIAEVGRGGFGVVYRALDPLLGRVVALKVLAPTLADAPVVRQRFLREARAAAAVRHPNVVLVHAVEDGPTPALVMEFVAGGSVQDRLDRAGPPEPTEAARVGAEVARGLAAAHAAGLVHRDIKPANVLLDAETGAAKLADFGLARLADDASLAGGGAGAGTPRYMSPEQARGEPIDARSDLFALGGLLYALATGRPPAGPFEATTPLPGPLGELVARLRDPDPDGRPGAAAVADALARPAAPRRARRRGPIAAAVGTAVAVAVILVTVFAPRRAPTGPPPHADAPFDAAAAAGHQRAWAGHLGVPVAGVNALGMRFRLIPAGHFRMGSTPAQVDAVLAATAAHRDWAAELIRAEAPARHVTIAEPFYLGEVVVTREPFARFADATGYRAAGEASGRGGALWNGAGFDRRPEYTWRNAALTPVADHPVPFVTLADAVALCRWLTERDGRTHVVPTEQQWEYACRAGSETLWPTGDDPSSAAGLLRLGPDVGAGLGPVGLGLPNAFGLRDMCGHAEQITLGPGYPVFRGGHCRFEAWFARSAWRHPPAPDDPGNFVHTLRLAIVGDLRERR